MDKSPPPPKKSNIKRQIEGIVPVLGTKQHRIFQQGIMSKIPSRNMFGSIMRKNTWQKIAGMPQEHPSSQFSSSSVQQVGQYQIPLVQTTSPFQNYLFLAEDPFS
jgi:hypothetical protein